MYIYIYTNIIKYMIIYIRLYKKIDNYMIIHCVYIYMYIRLRRMYMIFQHRPSTILPNCWGTSSRMLCHGSREGTVHPIQPSLTDSWDKVHRAMVNLWFFRGRKTPQSQNRNPFVRMECWPTLKIANLLQLWSWNEWLLKTRLIYNHHSINCAITLW